jgi:hypothetical protein
VLALSFARSTASMAFALRFSVLPLIDTMMRLAFDKGLEAHRTFHSALKFEHICEIERSAINLRRFTDTKYFETELHRHSKPEARSRKTPDS